MGVLIVGTGVVWGLGVGVGEGVGVCVSVGGPESDGLGDGLGVGAGICISSGVWLGCGAGSPDECTVVCFALPFCTGAANAPSPITITISVIANDG